MSGRESYQTKKVWDAHDALAKEIFKGNRSLMYRVCVEYFNNHASEDGYKESVRQMVEESFRLTEIKSEEKQSGNIAFSYDFELPKILQYDKLWRTGKYESIIDYLDDIQATFANYDESRLIHRNERRRKKGFTELKPRKQNIGLYRVVCDTCANMYFILRPKWAISEFKCQECVDKDYDLEEYKIKRLARRIEEMTQKQVEALEKVVLRKRRKKK